MAVPGRKPKPQGQARHRVPPRTEWVEVVAIPFDGDVPKLPGRRGGWPARTKRKWGVWSRMPHCVLWTDSDWDFAVDSLEIAAQFHEGNGARAKELRDREKVLGTTMEYRRDLRIRYVEPPEQETVTDVSNINDYRNRL